MTQTESRSVAPDGGPLGPAAGSDVADFPHATAPYRRELLAHCYRMTGSIHDAEDLVQETYLRAWRADQRFQGRASGGPRLFAVAPRVSLPAIERGGPRPLPSGLGPGSTDYAEGVHAVEPFGDWLQPAPDF